jgi:hypothetical protein
LWLYLFNLQLEFVGPAVGQSAHQPTANFDYSYSDFNSSKFAHSITAEDEAGE